MEKPCKVILGRFAEKQLRRLPVHIRSAFRAWAHAVEKYGIRTIRRLPGHHDEPLVGQRYGQRSVRLNRSYRVIYEETETQELIILGILEVNKHAY